ncbi:MAG: DUF4831 family protein [Mucinivorans sp.]
MKKVIITCAAALMSIGAMAQISAYKQGISAAVDGYALPRTVVQGVVSVEREVIVRGPYARFASQFLGVTGAPMTDKESFKILGARLNWATEPDPAMVFALDEKSTALAKVFTWIDPSIPQITTMAADKDMEGGKIGNQFPFTDVGVSTLVDNSARGLSIERTSAVEKSTEQMAADAAAVIFRIRKSRLDLITGEAGEYVFGEGLKAALNEMSRLEAEYMALFVGKRYLQRTEHTFSVLPEAGKNRVVAFRFSEAKGFAEPTDLTASPYNLEFAPENGGGQKIIKKSGSKMVIYRVPALERVTLTNGSNILASLRVPIFQKGSLTEAPVL